MKKRLFIFCLTIVLACLPLAFTACNDTAVDLTFTLAQVGGEADKATTTAVNIAFSGAVDALTAAEVVVSGAASASGAPVKKDADGKTWSVPVTVTQTGFATVKIIKTGVSAAAKDVGLYFYKAPDPDPADPIDPDPTDPDPTDPDPPDPDPKPSEGHKEFANANGFPTGYAGTVFTSNTMPNGMTGPKADQPNGQAIPGKVTLVYYDVGALGVTYQDSGGNKISGLRSDDPGVSTKLVGGDDAGQTHLVPPVPGNPYVGWTNKGEWFKITVDVQETDHYDVRLCYSKNGQNDKLTVWFDEDDKYPLNPTCTTYYHKWNNEVVIPSMPLKKGKCVLTVYLESGGFNLSYFDFTRAIQIGG